jgi:hypothetical protein
LIQDSEVLIFLGICGFVAAIAINQVHANRKYRKKSRQTDMRACMSFDLSQARHRWQKSSGMDWEMGDRVELEFRRYFGLIANSTDGLGLHSKMVDDFWHELILCTALYRSYCQAVAGRFIDHDPKGGGEVPYMRTWRAYREAYGKEPDAIVWPRNTYYQGDQPAFKAEQLLAVNSTPRHGAKQASARPAGLRTTSSESTASGSRHHSSAGRRTSHSSTRSSSDTGDVSGILSSVSDIGSSGHSASSCSTHGTTSSCGSGSSCGGGGGD